MSLLPRLKVKEADNSFMLWDHTGLYNSQNKGGFGIQTIRPEWVTSVTVVVEHIRTGKVSTPINLTGNLGKFEGEGQIMPWDIDSSWKKLLVGKYKFTYTINATLPSGVKKSPSTSVFCVAIKPAECCVDKMSGNVLNVDFNSIFKDEQFRRFSELSALMRLVKYALRPECSNMDAADRMVYYISQNCNCNC